MRILALLIALIILEVMGMHNTDYQVLYFFLFWPTCILAICRGIQVLSNTEDD